ncbi:hypothetical protein JB92DRAFT_2833266 [Gautieria morchelliformis]|nr:hypothetical protein JB92DRAFT_2833266 [Gautieria morchelliformis]
MGRCGKVVVSLLVAIASVLEAVGMHQEGEGYTRNSVTGAATQPTTRVTRYMVPSTHTPTPSWYSSRKGTPQLPTTATNMGMRCRPQQRYDQLTMDPDPPGAWDS